MSLEEDSQVRGKTVGAIGIFIILSQRIFGIMNHLLQFQNKLNLNDNLKHEILVLCVSLSTDR